MKQKLKNFLVILSTFTIIFGMMNIGGSVNKAHAATEYTSDYYTYTITNGEAEIIDFDDSIGGNITIPSTLGGYPVTSIGQFSFYVCKKLTSITIPISVKTIGTLAFGWCDNLANLTIPDTVTSIGDSAFLGCSSLAAITLPYGLTAISNSTFSDCTALTTIAIPNKVTIIGDHAFDGCTALTKATLPNGVTSIGESAFASCKSLVKINIPSSVLNIGAEAFSHCTSLPNISIPESVTSIGEGAFQSCTSFTKIVIPDSITTISKGLFAGCTSLSNITIPDSVLSIGDSAFNGCDALTSITIPDTVLSMGAHVFSSCNGLKSITIPESISSIGQSAFWNCKNLKSIVIPKTVTSIGMYAFNSCSSLTDIYYTGTETEWNEITISDYNDGLLNATIHYNYDASHRHSYQSTITTASTCTKTGVKTFSCECGDSYTDAIPATGHKAGGWQIVTAATTEKEGKKVKKCTVCNTVLEEQIIAKLKKDEPTKPTPVEEEIIKSPSTTTIKYGETLILHADFTNIPADAKIEWSVEGEGVTINPSEDGKTCAVTSTATGDATITAKYVDANGVEHVSEQEIESNASIWQKIVSFFKNLFGISRIIEQRIRF